MEEPQMFRSKLEPKPESPFRRIILTMVVVCLAVASYSTLASTTSNYVETTKATHELESALVNVEIQENTIYFTYHYLNPSSLDIVVQKIAFSVYANGKFIGSYDMRGRILLKPGEEDIIVEAKVHPVYMTDLENELGKSERVLWFVKGGTVILLPFEELTITIPLEEYWVMQ